MGEFRLRKSGGGSTLRGPDRLRGTTAPAIQALRLLQTPIVRNPIVVIPPVPPIVMQRIVQTPNVRTPKLQHNIAVPLSGTCVTVYPPAVAATATQQQIPVQRIVPGNGSGPLVRSPSLAHGLTVPRLVAGAIVRNPSVVGRTIFPTLLVQSPTVHQPQIVSSGFVAAIEVPELVIVPQVRAPAVARLGEFGSVTIRDEALMSVEISDS